MVVGAINEGQIFQVHDLCQRPKHQGKDSQDVGKSHIDTEFTVETLPNGVYRAGTDIPKNNAQSDKRKLRQTAFLFGLSALTVGLFRGRFLSPFMGDGHSRSFFFRSNTFVSGPFEMNNQFIFSGVGLLSDVKSQLLS
jgi:hypothetical protein